MRLWPKPAVVRSWDAKSDKLLAKASKRVARLSEGYLYAWAESVANDKLGEALAMWRNHRDQASIDELRMAVITLQAVVNELAAREGLDTPER